MTDTMDVNRLTREWFDISTAPKERGYGSYMVWCPERRNTYLVTWHDNGWDEPGWFVFGGGPLHDNPTMWQPRPASPGEEQQ